MLQQTQVTTVEPYFQRFVETLPSIEALAKAEEEQVLRLWEGLGYYRRARQMHKAAQTIIRDHGAVFPKHVEHVRRLPGIGRYTAGAILSIAFDARQPILEANTVRLFSRLLAYRGDPTSTDGQRLLWTAAEQLLPRHGSGVVNQALMDLGSQICTPRAPRCLICPLAAICPTNAHALQAVIPSPRLKRTVEELQEAAVIIRRGERVLLMRRTKGNRWIGLWDFPRFGVEPDVASKLPDQLYRKVLEMTGLRIESAELVTTLRHGVTRFRITLNCYSAAYASGKITRRHADDMRWLLPSQLDDYPLSTTGRKIARLSAAVS